MENTPLQPPLPSADEAARALREAETAARDVVERLELPGTYSLLTGTGNALLAYGIAVGNSDWRLGSVAFVASLVAVATLAAIARGQFRRRNGVWVNGLGGPRATLLVIVAFLAVLIPCIVGATALMVAGHPVWSAAVALVALPATAVADRAWMAAFRRAHRPPA